MEKHFFSQFITEAILKMVMFFPMYSKTPSYPPPFDLELRVERYQGEVRTPPLIPLRLAPRDFEGQVRGGWEGFLGYVLAIFIISIPPAAFAAEFKVSKENKPVEITEPVLEDVYMAGESITISSPIEGDVLAVGQTVAVNERVAQDIVAGGQNITLTNAVLDDAFLGGNTVTIEGAVEGDTFAAGQFVTLSEQSHVGEDAFLAGQKIEIKGAIDGNVRAAAEEITIGPTATIKGDLTVWGNAPIIEDGATIQGEVVVKERKGFEKETKRSVLSVWVVSVLTLFILAIALIYITPLLTKRSHELYQSNTGKSFLTGIVWMALFIPASILLLFTIIGWPFAIIVALVSAVLYILAAGLTAITVGSWIMNKLPANRATPQDKLAWSHALLGAVVYETVQLIGPVGWFITLIFVIIGFGSLLLTMWELLAKPKKSAADA